MTLLFAQTAVLPQITLSRPDSRMISKTRSRQISSLFSKIRSRHLSSLFSPRL